jgi:hypothetical protein
MPRRRKVDLPLRQPKAAKYQHDPLRRDVSSSRARSEEKSDNDEQEDIQGSIGFDLGEGPDNNNEAEVSSRETYLSSSMESILTFT